jgi:hypothetical protein
MVAEDRPKLPRASLRGEKLYIEGEKEPYFRDSTNGVQLRIDALTIRRGYTDFRDGKVLTESLEGIATLDGGDEFTVIGLDTDDDDTTPIQFYLYSVSDAETELHWRARIGFVSANREFRQDAHFWISAEFTSQYVDDLLAAVRRGHVDNISVRMKTTMWTQDPPLMSGTWRTWHLAPPTDGKFTHDPAPEHGYISSLTWEENFGAPKTKDDEVTAPKPQLVELPARVYSMLTALLVIVAALLVLTFLR